MSEEKNDDLHTAPSDDNTTAPQGEVREEREEETSTDSQGEAPEANTQATNEETSPSTSPANADEDEADTEEDLHTDEHEEDDQYADHHDELPDYDHMANEELLKHADHWVKRHDIRAARPHVEAIRTALLKRLDEERNEKKEEFLANGGVEIDFQYDQADRRAFREMYGAFKDRRRNARKELEAQLQVNLSVKKSIVETIKEIPASEGSAQEKYKQFRELQERWKATGPVPRSESRDLYNNYHFHVDQFYDFLRISNELRELDFKKNHEAKEELIKKAEDLSKNEINRDTFTQLQQLHKSWKEIGPVERDVRETMWEKFSEATKAIHDKRHAFYEELKANREERLKQKEELVNKMEALPIQKFKSHRDWQSAISQMNELRDAFKKLGRINLPGNDALWERYSEINRNFNRTKNQFYKELKREQRDNLEKKRELLAKAESLKDSTNWREAANELKALQRKWKTIGFAPRSESDAVWKEFRAACNYFFERLKNKNQERDEVNAKHLTAKEALLKKVVDFDPIAAKNGVEELKKFIDEWKAIGPVPRDKRHVEDDFNKTLDGHFSALKIDRKQSAMIRFENRLHHLSQDGDQRALDKEYDMLRRKIDDAHKELVQLENNMGFFAHSDPKNPLVREANKNIERQRDHIAMLKDKLAMLRQVEEEAEAEEAADSADTSNETDAPESEEKAEE